MLSLLKRPQGFEPNGSCTAAQRGFFSMGGGFVLWGSPCWSCEGMTRQASLQTQQELHTRFTHHEGIRESFVERPHVADLHTHHSKMPYRAFWVSATDGE